MSVIQPMYLEAVEQGGKTWLSLVKNEPTFLSPTVTLKLRLLLWLNKVENPADIPSPSMVSREV